MNGTRKKKIRKWQEFSNFAKKDRVSEIVQEENLVIGYEMGYSRWNGSGMLRRVLDTYKEVLAYKGSSAERRTNSEKYEENGLIEHSHNISNTFTNRY